MNGDNQRNFKNLVIEFNKCDGNSGVKCVDDEEAAERMKAIFVGIAYTY